MNEFSTFSICLPAGCDATCRFCIARMTGIEGFKTNHKLCHRNFAKAVRMAEIARINTVLITGKGEPLLYARRISEMLEVMDNKFPLIVLQTNGIRLMQDIQSGNTGYLEGWYKSGLTHISLSVAHWDSQKNAEIICREGESHYDLAEIVKALKNMGFMPRINVTMCKGYIDSVDKVLKFCFFAGENGAEITFRPVTMPEKSESPEIAQWVRDHLLDEETIADIDMYFSFEKATPVRCLYEFDYGGRWYDYNGHNVCLTNCLTKYQNGKPIRQLIFFPDNSVGFDWASKAALLLPPSQ